MLSDLRPNCRVKNVVNGAKALSAEEKLFLPEEVTPTTPLRLGVDAALAIPDGSMTGRPVADWPRVTTGRPEELVTGDDPGHQGGQPRLL